VAFSLWRDTFIAEMDAAGRIKAKLPEVKVVVGGPHLDLYATETMSRFEFVDYAVRGEGEKTFGDLLSSLSDNRSLEKVPGLFFRERGKIKSNEERTPIQNLDEIPFPAIDLIPLNKYHSIMAKNDRPIYILTSRGCPFKCAYCVDQQFGRLIRFHSSDYVINYIKWLVFELGVNEIHMYDDTFTVNKTRTLEICSKIKEEGLHRIPWTIRTRVDTVDEEILDNLWSAGCYRIGYGIESGNQEVMDRMRRGTNLEQVKQVIRLTKKYPFEIVCNFMIGYLGESKATYKDTINFANELDPDFAHFSITQVEPNSELFHQVSALNLFKEDDWRAHALGMIEEIRPENKYIPGEDYGVDHLEKMQTLAYVKFYFRPKKLLQQFIKVKNIGMLMRKSRMAVAMIASYFESICEAVRRRIFVPD
jgi:radical SAM superfamily enzyme YgiQ (UPF0313 family)